MLISDIGSTAETALLCNTTYYSGGHNSGGDWYTPNGTRVGHIYEYESGVPGFGRNRGPHVVRLIRNTATDPPAEGMYYCTVKDSTLTTQTVYVGIYHKKGG